MATDIIEHDRYPIDADDWTHWRLAILRSTNTYLPSPAQIQRECMQIRKANTRRLLREEQR